MTSGTHPLPNKRDNLPTLEIRGTYPLVNKKGTYPLANRLVIVDSSILLVSPPRFDTHSQNSWG